MGSLGRARDLAGLASERRSALEQEVLQGREHVRLGEEHLVSQRAIVERLATDGHDGQMARDLLKTFEEMQNLHVANLERAEAELAAL